MAPEERIVPPQTFGLGFGRAEAMHLWVGIGVMTLAFALAYIGGVLNLISYFQSGGFTLVFIIVIGSFAAVVTAFFLHEIAHKAVAQHYGALAEFRHSPAGLVVGLVTASTGFMFAMPGAVAISGGVTPRQQARISAAGPATNLAFAAVFIWLSLFLGTTSGRFRLAIPIFLGVIAFVNLLLAGFSLLPVPPITVKRTVRGRPISVSVPASDGYLVLMSSKAVFAVSIVEFVALATAGHLLGAF